MSARDRYRPDGLDGVYNSDEWWPTGLPEWIGERVAADDPLFVALDKGLRSFGWPAYNVPLPREDSWPGIALALAQRIRETDSARRVSGASPTPPKGETC